MSPICLFITLCSLYSNTDSYITIQESLSLSCPGLFRDKCSLLHPANFKTNIGNIQAVEKETCHTRPHTEGQEGQQYWLYAGVYEWVWHSFMPFEILFNFEIKFNTKVESCTRDLQQMKDNSLYT